MRKIFIVAIILTCFLSGCSRTWFSYKPLVPDLIGEGVQLNGNEITFQGKITCKSKKCIFTTKKVKGKNKEIYQEQISLALDALYEKITAKAGIKASTKETINATNMKIDVMKDWAWCSTNQTFVYAGIRADKVEMEISTADGVTTGAFSHPDVGNFNISAVDSYKYKIDIEDSNVYYKIQLANVKELPRKSGENFWVKKGDQPIILDGSNSQTYEIQPSRPFGKRLFRYKSMPNVSLLLKNGELFTRISDNLSSEDISIEEYANKNKWNSDSIYIKEYVVGQSSKQIVVLDIKAEKKDGGVEIREASIRYPEFKLNIKKQQGGFFYRLFLGWWLG